MTSELERGPHGAASHVSSSGAGQSATVNMHVQMLGVLIPTEIGDNGRLPVGALDPTGDALDNR